MQHIPLSNTKRTAQVDDEDYARVMQHKWFLVELGRPSDYHAAATIDGRTELMENFILGIPTPDDVKMVVVQ